MQLTDGLLQLVAVQHVAESAGGRSGGAVVAGRAGRRCLRGGGQTAAGLAALKGVLGRIFGLLQAAKTGHGLQKKFVYNIKSPTLNQSWPNGRYIAPLFPESWHFSYQSSPFPTAIEEETDRREGKGRRCCLGDGIECLTS